MYMNIKVYKSEIFIWNKIKLQETSILINSIKLNTTQKFIRVCQIRLIFIQVNFYIQVYSSIFEVYSKHSRHIKYSISITHMQAGKVFFILLSLSLACFLLGLLRHFALFLFVYLYISIVCYCYLSKLVFYIRRYL